MNPSIFTSLYAELAGGGASFDPLSVGTPKVFYNATFASESGGVLTALLDLSGNGKDATLPGGSEPNWTDSNAGYGGVATIDFPASASKRIICPDLGLTTGPFTVVLVADAQNTNGRYFTSNNGEVMIRRTGSAINSFGTSGAGGLSGGTAANPSIIIATFDGVSGKLRVNANTPVATGNNGAQDLTGQSIMLGNYAPSPISLFNQEGSLAYYLLYDGALADADCEYLNAGFSGLTGISIGA